METLMGFMGAGLVFLAIFILYIAGVAVVLQLVDWLRPTKNEPVYDPSVPVSSS